MTSERRLTILRLVAFLFVIGIVVAIFVFRDQVRHLYRFGYAGVFLATLISNATVFIPVPGVMLVFTLGAVFHPIPTAIFAGLGAATGELSGYLLGFSGQGLLERSVRYQRFYAWLVDHRKLSDIAIMGLAIIPNPFFDLAGVAAGSLKIPVFRFWIFCALGSIIKMLVFAYAGYATLNILFNKAS